MKDIVIYEQRKAAIKLVIQALLMTLASSLLAFMGIQDGNGLFLIIGGLGTVFFAVCLCVQIFRVIKRRPLFIIKKEGVLDTSTAAAFGMIPYSEISSFVLGKTLEKESIGIKLKDVEAYKKRANVVQQKQIKSNEANHFPDIVLRVDNLADYSGLVVYEILCKLLEEDRKENMK